MLVYCILMGARILLCFWCRFDMTHHDVVDYFDNPTRFVGYEEYEDDDEEDDELDEAEENLRK